MTIKRGGVARACVHCAGGACRRLPPEARPVCNLSWPNSESATSASSWQDHRSVFGQTDTASHLARARMLRLQLWVAVMQASAVRLMHLLRSSATIVVGALREARAASRHARRRRAAIRALEALDDRTLKDIGLHRTQIGSVVNALPADTRQLPPHGARPGASNRPTRSVFRPVGGFRSAASA